MYNLFDHYIKGERIFTQIAMPICEKYNLTYMELTVIMFLANHPELDTASDIVKCKRLTKSHVSMSVRSLEEKELLIREYRGKDRRSFHLRLTEKSEPIVADGMCAQTDFIDIMFKGTSDEERRMLTNILQRIDMNFEAYSAGRREET